MSLTSAKKIYETMKWIYSFSAIILFFFQILSHQHFFLQGFDVFCPFLGSKLVPFTNVNLCIAWTFILRTWFQFPELKFVLLEKMGKNSRHIFKDAFFQEWHEVKFSVKFVWQIPCGAFKNFQSYSQIFFKRNISFRQIFNFLCHLQEVQIFARFLVASQVKLRWVSSWVIKNARNLNVLNLAWKI